MVTLNIFEFIFSVVSFILKGNHSATFVFEMLKIKIMPSCWPEPSFIHASHTVKTPVVNDCELIDLKSWSIIWAKFKCVVSWSINKHLSGPFTSEMIIWESSCFQTVHKRGIVCEINFIIDCVEISFFTWNDWIITIWSRFYFLSKEPIFSFEPFTVSKILPGLDLWLTFAIFNVPVLWNATVFTTWSSLSTSIVYVVSVMVNCERESFWSQ